MGNTQDTPYFQVNDVAETVLIDRYQQKHWIDVRINKVNNVDPVTYDIEVLHAKQLRVNPYAIHVPSSKLREKKIPNGAVVDFRTPQGDWITVMVKDYNETKKLYEVVSLRSNSACIQLPRCELKLKEFKENQHIETVIRYGKQRGELWIRAIIEERRENGTYDLRVVRANKYNVSQQAIGVSSVYIRPILSVAKVNS